MLFVQHCMPLFAFSSHPIYIESENRGSRLKRSKKHTFCTGAQLDRVTKERIYGTLQRDICNTGKK